MSVPYEMLLHPELLNNEQLICIMLERHLHIGNIQSMRRDELLEVFHQYCVPFGQRKYRDSGRGKLLNKSRNMSPTPKPIKTTTSNHQELVNNQHRKQSHSNCERLKPPPDLLSGHIKRIKTEHNITQTYAQILVSKRKQPVDSVPHATDCPPPKRERKSITWP